MEIYKGTPNFPGIAIGKILLYQSAEYQIRQYLISNVKKEVDEFHFAVKQVKIQLEELCEKYSGTQETRVHVFREQISILESDSFLRAVEGIISSEKVNAAFAVMTTRDELSNTFRNLEESFIRKRIWNVREISNRLIETLGGITPKIDLGEEAVILVAESLTPTELMEMGKDKLLAVVTRQGSVVSHTAIMTKTMAIPSLMDIAPRDEWDGMEAIVDGYTGTLYLQPDSEMRREYKIRQQADVREQEELLKLKNKKDCTIDGRKIALYANTGSLEDLNSVLFYGAEGIGLLRSEFQYLGRETYPGENELFLAYKKIAEVMGNRLVVIRTADLGGDKQEGYLEIPREDNPLMGNRGIRLCLDRKDMFRTQLRALYRASAYGNLALMYPMITSEEEMDEIDQLLLEVKEELREMNVPFREIPAGIMIETPAAVMISRELAARVDFLSIGTNDLAQYILAMDRQNPLLRNKYNDHHPAILRMVRMVVENAHKEGCEVCICGEMAADTTLTETLLRMGVDSLSVVPACILPVRKAIRETDLSRKISVTEEKFLKEEM